MGAMGAGGRLVRITGFCITTLMVPLSSGLIGRPLVTWNPRRLDGRGG